MWFSRNNFFRWYNIQGGGITMILRIIDKDTKLFLRDDFTFDEATELGLAVEPSQGLLTIPKWNGSEWIESGIPYVVEE